MKTLGVALVGVAAMVGSAIADDATTPPRDPAALEHYERGRKLYDLARYREAIAEFEAGVMVERAPLFFYNIAQAARLSKQYEKSIQFYEKFLEVGKPEGQVRALAEGFIEQMKAELAAAASSAPPTGADPPVSTQRDVNGSSSGVDGSSSGAWYRDPIGWTLTGSGLVVAAIGGGLYLDARSLDDQAARESDQDAILDLRAQADDRRQWATVTLLVGGGLLASGIVKLALFESPKARGLSLIPGATGFTIVGSF